MFVVKLVGKRHKLLIPESIARLVATNEQDRSAARVERVERAIRASRMLYALLPQSPVPRDFDAAAVGKLQVRPVILQQFHAGLQGRLLLFG